MVVWQQQQQQQQEAGVLVVLVVQYRWCVVVLRACLQVLTAGLLWVVLLL